MVQTITVVAVVLNYKPEEGVQCATPNRELG